MTNAPERIWADATRQWSSVGWSQSNEFVGDVEYVRADIVQSLTAERDRLRSALTDTGAYLDRGLGKMAFNIIRAALKGETP